MDLIHDGMHEVETKARSSRRRKDPQNNFYLVVCISADESSRIGGRWGGIGLVEVKLVSSVYKTVKIIPLSPNFYYY
jgi:hypothetical protein